MTNHNYKTCLLLDDDLEDQDFFLRTLHMVCPDIRCYAVSNGEEAFFMLRDADIKPDIIFTDIDMPRMNGFEFVRKLREVRKFQDIPVVAYSASHSPNNIHRMQMLGVVAFYSKMQFQKLPQILAKYFAAADRVRLR